MARSEDTVSLFTRGDIEKHHKRLSLIFDDHLDNMSGIMTIHAYRTSWYKRTPGEDIEFYVWDRNETRGMRSGGRGTCPIVRTREYNPTWQKENSYAWVGWRQVWIKKK